MKPKNVLSIATLTLPLFLLACSWTSSHNKQPATKEPQPLAVQRSDCSAATEKKAIDFSQSLHRFSRHDDYQSKPYGQDRGGATHWVTEEITYLYYQLHEDYKAIKKETVDFSCQLSPVARIVLGSAFGNLQNQYNRISNAFLTEYLPNYSSSQEPHVAQLGHTYENLIPKENSCPQENPSFSNPNLVRGWVAFLIRQLQEPVLKAGYFQKTSAKDIFLHAKKIQFHCSVWNSKRILSQCFPEVTHLRDTYSNKFEYNLAYQDEYFSELCTENDAIVNLYWSEQ